MCTKPKDDAPAPRNPDHDPHAAGIYQAIALRFYARYADARERAKFRGEDLPVRAPVVAESLRRESLPLLGVSGQVRDGANLVGELLYSGRGELAA